MNRQAFATAWLLSILLSAAASAATVRTVALSGQQAPGTSIAAEYRRFGGPPVLNDAGQTAFLAALIDDNTGVWSEGSGSLSLVARTGIHAPGTPSGVNYSRFDNIPPVLNNAGQTAFFAILTGTDVAIGANNEGIWSEGSGSLALVARRGSQSTGTPSGVNYDSINSRSLILNDAGQTAFNSRLTGIGVAVGVNDVGIWSEGAGSLALVARSGSQAPGNPNGVNYGGVEPFSWPVLNDAGQTAFSAFLTGSSVVDDKGNWSEGVGGLALVARKGSQAPGMPQGVNYNFVGSPVLNDAGQTAFVATVTGSGVDSSNRDGIWSDRSGSLALVIRSGNQAPGTPNGVNYRSFFSRPALNNAGQTAFQATLAGSGVDSTNDEGIWSEGSAGLALVAREGSQAPGTPSGVNFTPFNLSKPVLNDAGQTALFSYLTGSSVDSTNDQGIWATNRSGALQLVVRSGDLLEVSPGDFRTIGYLGFTPGTIAAGTIQVARSSGFNNLGQLAFSATFTDGSSGIFVSNRVAIPEPTSFALFAVGVLGLVGCARRRRIRGMLLCSVNPPWANGRNFVGPTLLSIFAVAFAASAAQGESIEWIRQLGTASADESNGVSADRLGNVYISGYTEGSLGTTNAGSRDAFVSKYDAGGTLQWTQQLGTGAEERGYGVSADGLGNVYLSGYTYGGLGGPNAGSMDAFVSKYDAAGTLQWTRQLGTSSDDNGYGVSADRLGNVFISGYAGGSLDGPFAGGFYDAFVSKYDATGTLQWTRQLGTNTQDQSSSVSADGLGNVYLTGWTDGSLGAPTAGSFDAFVSKYDASGALQWVRQLGTTAEDNSLGVSADGLGMVYISGYTISSLGAPNVDAFVSKYDAAGVFQWTRKLGTSSYDVSNGVSADGRGNVYISGYTGGSLGGPTAGSSDAFVSKYDAAGDLLWTQQFGTGGRDESYAVSADGQGIVYISGLTFGSLGGPKAGERDAFVARIADSTVPESSSLVLAAAGLLRLIIHRRTRYMHSPRRSRRPFIVPQTNESRPPCYREV